MMTQYKRISVVFVFTLSMVLLTACGNIVTPKEKVPVPGGYKPVIYYHEELYWLSYDRPLDELPAGYSVSLDTISHALEDAYELPDEEGETSAVNANNVGASIYVHEKDDKKIIIKSGNSLYTVFEKD